MSINVVTLKSGSEVTEYWQDGRALIAVMGGGNSTNTTDD